MNQAEEILITNSPTDELNRDLLLNRTQFFILFIPCSITVL